MTIETTVTTTWEPGDPVNAFEDESDPGWWHVYTQEDPAYCLGTFRGTATQLSQLFTRVSFNPRSLPETKDFDR